MIFLFMALTAGSACADNNIRINNQIEDTKAVITINAKEFNVSYKYPLKL